MALQYPQNELDVIKKDITVEESSKCDNLINVFTELVLATHS